MGYKYSLGIGVSKLTFDYALIDRDGTVLAQGRADNRPAAVRAWLKEMAALLLWGKTPVCMEHSGYYGAHLLNALHASTGASVWVESALRIKRSLGLQRGKSDRADALRIAAYCLDSQRKAVLWRPTDGNIERLGLLLSHRDRLVRNLHSVRNPLNEESGFVAPARRNGGRHLARGWGTGRRHCRLWRKDQRTVLWHKVVNCGNQLYTQHGNKTGFNT